MQKPASLALKVFASFVWKIYKERGQIASFFFTFTKMVISINVIKKLS